MWEMESFVGWMASPLRRYVEKVLTRNLSSWLVGISLEQIGLSGELIFTDAAINSGKLNVSRVVCIATRPLALGHVAGAANTCCNLVTTPPTDVVRN